MNTLRLLLPLLVTLALMAACQPQEPQPQGQSPRHLTPQLSAHMTQLGAPLPNPYAVHTMRQAWDSLQKYNPTARQNTHSISTTHHYLRFMPQTWAELDLLKDDSTLILYDYPLDRSIEVYGEFYHDPSLPLDQPTYQYAAVPLGKALPTGVAYELLEELCIPEEAPAHAAGRQQGRPFSDHWATALTSEALRLTGHLKPRRHTTAKKVKAWRPSGQLSVYDDVHKAFVPIEGIKVRARHWFTTVTGHTNAQGKFTCSGTIKRTVHYTALWERTHFSIRSGTAGQAKLNGPANTTRRWVLQIGNTSRQQYYAEIFRAAYHYYYKNIKSLRRPPLNYTLQPQMKIAAIHDRGPSNGVYSPWKRIPGILNWIKLWGAHRNSMKTYSTTIYELAHAAHWEMDHSCFNNTELKVKESWARGVQWELTRMVYPDYEAPERRISTPDYTLVVVDLIDPIKGDSLLANDKDDLVEGYTIKQIESALEGAKSWENWRDNIINHFENKTEHHVEGLFADWD